MFLPVEIEHDETKKTAKNKTKKSAKAAPEKTKSKRLIENPEKKRLIEKHKLSKKSPKGTFAVTHDVKSGTNYVTVQDSKAVSFLSTAAGVTTLQKVGRYEKKARKKVDVEVPAVFKLYNQHMGLVDLQDQHCSDLQIHIGGKKWTWVVLKRFIQMALSNSLILYNLINEKEMSAEDFSLCVSDSYLKSYENTKDKSKHLKPSIVQRRRLCSICFIKTVFYCFECKNHFCDNCFAEVHKTHKKITLDSKRICRANNDCKKCTSVGCDICNIHICTNCFDDFHK